MNYWIVSGDIKKWKSEFAMTDPSFQTWIDWKEPINYSCYTKSKKPKLKGNVKNLAVGDVVLIYAKGRKEVVGEGEITSIANNQNSIAPGDYVMVHAGLAIARVAADEAAEADKVMEELNDN